jgi:hypothetical protein
MIAFLLTLLLSKALTIAVPVALLTVGGFLLRQKLTHLALTAALVAAGWLVTGLVYQEGVAACEASTAAKVAQVQDAWKKLTAIAARQNKQDLDALSADNAQAEVELAALKAQRASARNASNCVLTQEKADAINGRR